jgi:hypothetical protein
MLSGPPSAMICTAAAASQAGRLVSTGNKKQKEFGTSLVLKQPQLLAAALARPSADDGRCVFRFHDGSLCFRQDKW